MATYNENLLARQIKSLTFDEMMGFAESVRERYSEYALGDKNLDMAEALDDWANYTLEEGAE